MSLLATNEKFLSKIILVLLRMRVWFLMRWQHIRFPERAVGGDQWIYGWRLNFLLGRNDKESLIWCKKLIQPGMVVLDIGAHIGYYTRLLSGLVKRNGLVLAFEPCPENWPVLRYNLQRLHYKNVQISDKAVSFENGRATLFISPGHSNHSFNAGYTAINGKVEVETIALDSFLPACGVEKVDFVKIDVEGAELLVLEGMREIIKNSPNLMILIEYNPTALRAGGYTPARLLEVLKSLSFKPYQILSAGNLAEVNSSMDETINLLCIPKTMMSDFQ